MIKIIMESHSQFSDLENDEDKAMHNMHGSVRKVQACGWLPSMRESSVVLPNPDF